VAEKPLSQSEIDSLVAGLSPKRDLPPSIQTCPPAEKKAAPASSNNEDLVKRVKQATMSDMDETAGTQKLDPESQAFYNNRLDDLTRRLNRLEAAIISLRQINKVLNDQLDVKPEDFGEMVERVRDLGSQLKSMSAKLQGTLGYDIYHSFECDKCGSQGYVSTVFHCTKCGAESWRGWWPK
jgi:hypothetical protein